MYFELVNKIIGCVIGSKMIYWLCKRLCSKINLFFDSNLQGVAILCFAWFKGEQSPKTDIYSSSNTAYTRPKRSESFFLEGNEINYLNFLLLDKF